MAVTISIYNHTARLFAAGEINLADTTFGLMLCTAATFNAANTTLASVTKTETTAANGYTAGGLILDGVAATTVTTNDAKLDASDAVWIASGGSISAAFALLYSINTSTQRVLAFINFDGTQTAADGTEFKVAWNAGGIFTFTVA